MHMQAFNEQAAYPAHSYINFAYRISWDVTEFEFELEYCWNQTVFAHLNFSNVERHFLVEFKFGFELRNHKLF